MGEGVLLLIWTVVDRRCGEERKDRREGEAEIERKKRQMSRGSRVAIEVMHSMAHRQWFR